MKDKNVTNVAGDSMKKLMSNILLFVKKCSLKEGKNSILKNKEH